MAYVAPNSDLWLCRGVPLDSDYHYSYRPASASAQRTAILAYTAYTLTNQSYIRHTNNTIRVAIAPDDALGCNYMAFRNTSFGNKMFYAFITDVEYVNNETSLITYSIDVLQTYFFDVNILPSYIEREHSASDAIGDSVTPEPTLASGQEIYSNELALQHDVSGLYTVVVTTKDFLNPTEDRRVYTTFTHFALSGLVLAGAYNICNVTSESLQDFISVLTNYIETAGGLSEIIAVYSIPKSAYPNGDWDSTHSWLAPRVNPNMPVAKYYTVTKPTVSDALDGYVPKNAKLYTYPYCFLRVTDYRGATKDLRYEYLSTSQLRVVNSGILPSPSEQLSPVKYAGTDPQMSEWDNAMWINNYPTPTFTISEFSDYYGANHNSQIAQQLANIVSSLFGGATSIISASGYDPEGSGGIPISNPISNLAGSINNAITFYGKQQDLVNRSVTINPNSSSFLSLLYGRDLFGTYRVCFNSTVLRIYDDYFTMFGYAVNKLKKPNFLQATTRRPAYNYCKTAGANITSKTSASNSVPSQALADIKRAYNNGVCWWEVLANVGNYDLANAPVT